MFIKYNVITMKEERTAEMTEMTIEENRWHIKFAIKRLPYQFSIMDF